MKFFGSSKKREAFGILERVREREKKKRGEEEEVTLGQAPPNPRFNFPSQITRLSFFFLKFQIQIDLGTIQNSFLQALEKIALNFSVLKSQGILGLVYISEIFVLEILRVEGKP